jgi:2Fe-2S ferredoxin
MWSPSFLSSASTSLLRQNPLRNVQHLHRHRCLASGTRQSFRYFSSKDSDVDPEIYPYLKDTLGIPPELHKGIVRAMQSVYGNKMKLEKVESFGAAGVQALADSVAKEVKKLNSKGVRPSVPIHFTIPHHKTEFDLKWKQGDSLLDLAHSSNGEELLMEYMEGTCGGHMSCCSCHLYLDETTFAALKPPSSAELDMLDLAYERKATSRLGCQVQLLDNLLTADHTITVTIPTGVNNVWS